jgi:hypothetical protein
VGDDPLFGRDNSRARGQTVRGLQTLACSGAGKNLLAGCCYSTIQTKAENLAEKLCQSRVTTFS